MTHDNAISLAYEDGRLAQVIDSVGRVVRVRRHGDGRIAAFEVKNAFAHGRWETRRRYAFDARGDLVAAEDAEGRAPCAFTTHYPRPPRVDLDL